MHTLITIAVTAVVCLPVGYYLHYRYGSTVKNAVAQIETRVAEVEKKLP